MKCHWPVWLKKGSGAAKPENVVDTDLISTWKAMESLYDSKKVKAIGVSNYSIKKLGLILENARIPPAVNQVESHPHWSQPKLHEFCKSKNVHVSVS